MKRLFLFLLLFSAKPIWAQTFNVGGSLLGFMAYYDHQQTSYYGPDPYVFDFPFELSGQYVFKNPNYGLESDLLYYAIGINNSNVNFNSVLNITSADYFVSNPFPSLKVFNLQLKAGGFVSYFDYNNTITPHVDYGPAVGVYISFRISQKCCWGLDISKQIGLQNFTIPGEYDGPNYLYNQSTVTSKVTYTIFLLKLMYKI